MTTHLQRLTMVCFALAPIAVLGCGSKSARLSPFVEETSTAFLQTETEAVATHVGAAISQLGSDPETAAAELAVAQEGLDHLLTYYLPLLEARERAYDAYRYFHLDQTGRTAEQLDQVEAILISVAEADSGGLRPEMEDPLEKLEHARLAVETGADEASEALETLAARLNQLLLKGGLILAS